MCVSQFFRQAIRWTVTDAQTQWLTELTRMVMIGNDLGISNGFIFKYPMARFVSNLDIFPLAGTVQGGLLPVVMDFQFHRKYPFTDSHRLGCLDRAHI